MEPSDQSNALARLTEQLASGHIGRRSFLRRGAALAVSLPTLGAIMAATAQHALAQSPSAPAAPMASMDASMPLIAFLGRDQQQVRWAFDAAGFKKRAEELGVPYLVQFIEKGDDPALQTSAAEALLA
ncbi:MAG: hypothetical protein LH650_12330, partial [Chloroflexi bacterium]|nr:hypothetical protein [Chloroflexota bacterium]